MFVAAVRSRAALSHRCGGEGETGRKVQRAGEREEDRREEVSTASDKDIQSQR